MNNASTDRTTEVVSKFPVRLVSEDKKGLLYARERGRLVATGEIVVNIDADCLPEADWLARGLAYFDRNEIAAITGPYDYFDGKPLFRKTSLFLQKYLYGPINTILQMPGIKSGAILVGGNNFIRASVLEKMGGYNTALTFYGEDTDTAKRVANYGNVIFSRKIVMKTSARRFHNEGTLKITLKYWFHFFKVIFGRKRKYQSLAKK